MSQSRLPASWNPESSAQKMLCDERDSEGEPVCFGGTTPNPQGPLCKEAEEQESTTLIVQDGERSNSELALAGIARRVSYDIASIAEQREAARRSLEILRSSGSRGWCREENGRQSIAAEGSINRQREAANLVLSLFGSNEPGGMYREWLDRQPINSDSALSVRREAAKRSLELIRSSSSGGWNREHGGEVLREAVVSNIEHVNPVQKIHECSSNHHLYNSGQANEGSSLHTQQVQLSNNRYISMEEATNIVPHKMDPNLRTIPRP
jgi:hypothetical protein